MSKIHVEKFLKEKNYKINFLKLIDSSTVNKAANEIGVTTNEIAKTLSFFVKGEPIVVVMSGDAKINNKKYKDFFKTKAKMIPYDKVKLITNHPVGGVCPFGLRENVIVYLDESLKALEYIYPAAGENNLALKISIEDLEKITNGIWVNVTTFEKGET